jgi:hypothetical protein
LLYKCPGHLSNNAAYSTTKTRLQKFLMKLFFIIIVSFFSLCFTAHPDGNYAPDAAISTHYQVKKVELDSPCAIKIINNSSLKYLPRVIRDLSIALGESDLHDAGLLNKKGFDIYLNDVRYKSFEISATVITRAEDASYHILLNRYNKQASDKALAATLIHEIMHCVLLDIYRNAIRRDRNAVEIIKYLDSILRNRLLASNQNFFYLMNSGEDGQHELMYHIFYPAMVSLLIRFAEIHKPAFVHRREPELLMWTGLQKTGEFGKLSREERWEIEAAILREKGLMFNQGD